ncbi:hypothetical protein LAWI1_G005141 [Lachnellula willkommii]|uniref:Rhodopsin domain-containing protein n=1 Tax=Lachnellula willkommii TaxID=215461 RepID=A0A559M707_9HELO|nr:hypothetical protein LAWI1_G005141 [Lachnellula willkommii]
MDIPKPDGPDHSIALGMLVSCWILYGAATITILLRVIAKLSIKQQLGVDDALMTLALLLGIANFSLDTAAVQYGLGRHFFYLTPFERVHSMKYEFLGQPVGILSPMFGRLSFMIYLLNIIVTSKPKKWFIYSLAAQHIIINVVTIILILAQCPHFATLWDPIGTPGRCWNPSVQADFGYFQGATNTLTDIVLTVMPISIIWNLQLAKKLKIALSVLLGLSSFAMIASIIRTMLTARIADRDDFTYNVIVFIIWCTVENCTVIITSSIPTLRPLFVRPKRNTSSYEMQNDYSAGSRASKVLDPRSKIRSQVISRGYATMESSEDDIMPFPSPPKGAILKETSQIIDTMTSCAPFSSIPSNSLHNVALLSHNASNTDITSFENCCVKVSGAYTSPEGDCYSHCYFYDSASATRLQNCFLVTQDNPNNNTTNPNFRIYTDAPTTAAINTNTRASASASASGSVVTLRPLQWSFNISKPSNTTSSHSHLHSHATAASRSHAGTLARHDKSTHSSSNWTVPSTTASTPAQTQTSISVVPIGTFTNATVTGNVIITATGSPSIPAQPAGSSTSTSTSTKTSGAKAVRGARMGVVVGLAVLVALFG